MALMRARQQLLAFLLRHGRTYEKGKTWTQRHRVWLAGQVFDQPVHQIVFQDYVEAIFTAQLRPAAPTCQPGPREGAPPLASPVSPTGKGSILNPCLEDEDDGTSR